MHPETALEQLTQARTLAADLLVQFTKAGDAANRSVMADTDDASVAFAREAEQATQAVQKDSEALKPMLMDLRYSNETRLLDEFDGRFAEYREARPEHPGVGSREHQPEGAEAFLRSGSGGG